MKKCKDCNKSMKEISITQHVELRAHIEKLNEKAKAWMRASPSNGFRMAALYDEKDIEDAQKYHGITTPAEFDALLAWNDFYDLYKDKHGIRPRHTKWSDNTAEGWELEIRNL